MLTLPVMITTCLGLGAGLGFLGGLLGIGGGLIAIPTLIYLFGLEQQLAQGTVLVMIIPNVLLSFYHYNKRNKLDYKKIFFLCIISSIFSSLSSYLAINMEPAVLKKLFSGFMFVIAIYYCYELMRNKKQSKARLPAVSLPLLGILSGLAAGFFTVGGGLVVVPLLIALYAYTQTQAQGTSLALIVPGALVALVTYSLAGHVSWSMGLPLAVGGVISVSWGVTLAHQLPARILKFVFLLVLIGVGLAV